MLNSTVSHCLKNTALARSCLSLTSLSRSWLDFDFLYRGLFFDHDFSDIEILDGYADTKFLDICSDIFCTATIIIAWALNPQCHIYRSTKSDVLHLRKQARDNWLLLTLKYRVHCLWITIWYKNGIITENVRNFSPSSSSTCIWSNKYCLVTK